MSYFENYWNELIATGILLLVMIIVRIFSRRAVRRYAKTSQLFEHRTNLVLKYISFFITILAMVAMVIIWGVKPEAILLTVSSVITVVGVALIAEWSILSNITAGIILLLSFPFKIGDTIMIHDKDFPVQGEIDDIRAFHTLIRTKEGQLITYPNNLLLKKGVSIVKFEVTETTDFVD